MDRIDTAKSKFSHFYDKPFRKYQKEAIEYTLNSKSPVVVINASTGSGKSLLGTCLCDIYPNAIYLVHSKALQEQIGDDFSEFTILKGRSNYACNLHWSRYKPVYADECPFSKASNCPKYDMCNYRRTKIEALGAKYRVLNYKYFLTEANYIGKFSTNGVLIADEADTLENELLSFIKLIVTESMIKRYCLRRPRWKTAQAKDGVKSWLEWAQESKRKIKSHIALLTQTIERVSANVPEKLLKRFAKAKSFLSSLDIFCKHVDDTWLLNIQKTTYGQQWEFFPTWITPELTEQYLLRHCNKLILMSATFPSLPVLSKTLGIPVDKIDLHVVPSTFPKENKPIYLENVADMSRKGIDADSPKLLKRIKEILNEHKDVKGLIHCNSYKIRDIVMSINDPRMITHNSTNREDVLEKFKASSEPLVLVSPSMDRGVSLDDNLCRFIIISKAPFLNLGNKQVSKRLYSGKIGQTWYSSDAANSMEQMSGRGVRSASDTCKIFIIDKCAIRLICKNPSLFSKDFIDCIV